MSNKLRHCVCCDDSNIKYPVVDYSTNFTFCDGCHSDVNTYLYDHGFKRGYSVNLSNWLIAIGIIRQHKKSYARLFTHKPLSI